MKHFLVAFVFGLLFASSAAGQGRWTVTTTAGPNCPFTVQWEDSGFPNDPFPAGKFMKSRLEPPLTGFMNAYNFEIRTKQFFYSGPSHCTFMLAGLPVPNGQGFYGYAHFQGLTNNAAGYTQIIARNQQTNVVFVLSGVNKNERNLRLSDLCIGVTPACRIIIHGTVWFFTEQ